MLKTNIKNSMSYSSVCEALIFIWVLFLVSADLKIVISSHIHWYVTALILPFITIDCLYSRKIKIDLFFILASIFLLSIYFSIPWSLYLLNNLGTYIKLSLIFISYLLIGNNVAYLRAAFAAFIFAAVLNVILFLLGFLFDISYLSGFAGSGIRWMTLLNMPGSLANLGISVFVYSLYCFIGSKKISLKTLALFLSCLLLIIFDGSRTVFLAMLLGVFYCSVLIFNDHSLWKGFSKKVIVGVMIIALGVACFSFFAPSRVKNKLVFRSNNVLEFIKNEKTISGLKKSDNMRYLLIKEAIRSISKSPLIGKGIYSTGIYFRDDSNIDENKPDIMNVHMAYLGVWGDFGILAFISFTFLAFFWLVNIKRVFCNIRNIEDVRLKALGYNAIFLLFFFAFRSLFHPLSNEWSEWILVLIPAGIYWQFARNKVVEFYG